MRRVVETCVAVVSLMLVLPSAGFTQASITGVVRDTSGAVLPGVTVEASSTALIEKVRTVVTDGSGQYRIVDLRPGTYAVTFTLAGFNTCRREAALVDVQSTTEQRVVGHEVADAVPSSRMPAGLGALIPGMVPAT